MDEFKHFVLVYADLCDIEIKSLRKSKDDLGLYVYGINGKTIFLFLNDFIENRNQTIKDLCKGFNKSFPRIEKVI